MRTHHFDGLLADLLQDVCIVWLQKLTLGSDWKVWSESIPYSKIQHYSLERGLNITISRGLHHMLSLGQWGGGGGGVKSNEKQ